MSGRGFRTLFVLAGLLTLLGAAGASAQNALAPLNLVPNAPDVLGRVPNHLVWLKHGLQAVQDPLDGQLVFLSDDGHVIGRAALPPRFLIGSIVAEKDRVRLIDASGRQQVVVERSIDPVTVTDLQPSAIRAGGAMLGTRMVRKSSRQILYSDSRHRSGNQLDVRSISPGTLAQVYEIGMSASGDRYIVSEQILSAAPSLQVSVFVQKFDKSGRVTGAAHIPLDDMEVVPRNFVTVTGEGELRVLVPTAGGVTIREIQLSSPAGSKKGESDYKSLGVISRETKVESNVAGDGDATELPVPSRRFKFRAVTPPITRSRVLTNAKAYLNVNWVMRPENYANRGIENVCQPQRSKFWLRPTMFTQASIDKAVGPMPYRWGGDDTPESFKIRIGLGALAGDICTCRDPGLDYCLVQESAGVDCSGFVSRAWGIEKRGTSGLLDVASELNNLADLRPGDAFVWPGRHTRLFIAPGPGSALAFSVLESSTRQDCEGVCQRTYRPSELNGYRLIRYSGITN